MNKINLLQTAKPIPFNTKMVKAILDGRKTQTRRVVGDKLLNEIYKNDCYIDDGQIFESCMCQGMPDGSGGLEVDRWEEDVTTTYSKYKVGDVLWVREPAKIIGNHKQIGNIYERTCNFKYLADDKIIEDFNIPYRFSSLHINQFLYKNLKGTWLTGNKSIPNGCIKEMARIFLKVTNVRVERLQDISKEDSLKEIGKGSWLCELANMYPNYQDYQRGFNDIDYDLQGKNVNGAICSFRTLWNSTANNGYKWEDNPYVFVYKFEKVEVC
ncbi:ASCH domain-containing protein [Aliarcobacter butzleri]|uniref:hypothetical protein n=1 Tax=Aliarcobacter butzleri TaxID=28197 RepID=UPI0021B5D89C|nr:hypothetical protein [Aliarcobacter butzleri]MCT7643879.1 hypothetical protein [Aliarcobacter butzleri]